MILIAFLSIYLRIGYCTALEPVKLTTGHTVEGFKRTTLSGYEANVFLGIPFAEPPIGALRFQKTQPLRTLGINDKSRSVISCKSYMPSCWQNHSLVGDERIKEMSEDCLYLNVFANLNCRAENSTKCPILYYIHGGAYEFDSPTLFSIDVLIENFASTGLVLVTVPYRLGVFGFWSTGGQEAAGNYGLYDVLEGLEWVQREIHKFGGDPNRVTIMGQSSGAAIVSLLTLTPKSAGLFHRAILMSRAPLITDELTQYEKLAQNVGCASKSDWISSSKSKKSKIIDCMRQIDPKHLVDTYFNLELNYGLTDVRHLTAPRIDGPGGLFAEPLESLIAKRRTVDAIVGTVAEEFGINKFTYLDATATNISQMCSSEIKRLNVKYESLLITECQRRYVLQPLEDKNLKQSGKFSLWAEQMAKLKNDISYFAPAFGEAKSLLNANATIYLYSFDYVKRGMEGVAPWHAFDLPYVLGNRQLELDDRDHEIRSLYVSYFVNFTKYANPTPETKSWKPLTRVSDSNYLSINLPEPIMKSNYYSDSVLFWNDIVQNIGAMNARVSDRIVFFEPEHPTVQRREIENANSSFKRWMIFGVIFPSAAAVTVVFVWAFGFCTFSKWRKEELRNRRREKLLNSKPCDYDTFNYKERRGIQLI